MPKPVEEPFDQFQQYYRTPNNRTTTQNFQLFLWNPDEGAIFGRTPSKETLFSVGRIRKVCVDVCLVCEIKFCVLGTQGDRIVDCSAKG
uniref:Uncharacterized protein n=1 Tax=Anopheles epiroticus TaxID=199890 RepID=A0A182PJN8_9DIPT